MSKSLTTNYLYQYLYHLVLIYSDYILYSHYRMLLYQPILNVFKPILNPVLNGRVCWLVCFKAVVSTTSRGIE